MNSLIKLKLNQQYASPSTPLTPLTPLTTLGSRLKFATLLALLLFIPALSLKASAVNPVANQIIVKYKDPSQSPLASSETGRQTRAQLSQEQSTYKAIAPKRTDLILIESENSETLLERLKKDPNVEYAVPNTIKKLYGVSAKRNDVPNDPHYSKQWALENTSNTNKGSDIDFLKGMALSRKPDPDNPVIIAIIDTSFAINNLDLKNQLWVNKEEIPNNRIDDDNNGYIDDIHGYHFANNSADVIGDQIHGSHVAGISIAENNNEQGISGVFPEAKFIALACEVPDGLAFHAILSAKSYVKDLKDRGYNIVAVNASYGDYQANQAEFNSLQELSNSGILFCTASGNDGWNLEIEKDHNHNGIIDEGEDINGDRKLNVSYPNSYPLPNIIAVAATNKYRDLAYYSNYGSSEVDIAAPGSSIYSTVDVEITEEKHLISLGNNREYGYELIEFSQKIPFNGLSGDLINCGTGLYVGNFSDAVNGNIALIQRSEIPFDEYPLYLIVESAMFAGATAVIIYNNVPEEEDALENWKLESDAYYGEWIPTLKISQADGLNIVSQLPQTATIAIERTYNHENSYRYLSGTSMASPVVTAAVAFAAHNFPDETMAQRRARILDNVEEIPDLANKVVTGGVVNLRKIVDTDEDNLPDWWEMDHFSTLNNTNSQDSDNDGYSNRDEFLSETDPTDASDRPSFKTDLNVSNLSFSNSDAFSFEFMTHPGYSYTIQSMNSLSENTWIDTTQSNMTGDGIPMKVTIDDLASSNEDTQFFRLQASPE